MFYGCTALTKAPELPATTLKMGCYSQMFKGCSNLKEVTIKADANKEFASASLDWWLDGVASKGIFRCKKDFYDEISSTKYDHCPPLRLDKRLHHQLSILRLQVSQ